MLVVRDVVKDKMKVLHLSSTKNVYMFIPSLSVKILTTFIFIECRFTLEFKREFSLLSAEYLYLPIAKVSSAYIPAIPLSISI